MFFFFNDTATTEIYTLSLHDALPISAHRPGRAQEDVCAAPHPQSDGHDGRDRLPARQAAQHQDQLRVGSRSEEHTSELQSRQYLVCRLLLEKKKQLQSHRLSTIKLPH